MRPDILYFLVFLVVVIIVLLIELWNQNPVTQPPIVITITNQQ